MISIICLLLCAAIVLFIENDVFLSTVNIDHVQSVDLTVTELFHDATTRNTIHITITENEKMKEIMELEAFVRKHDGGAKNRFLKTKAWTIHITYLMKDGEEVSRQYAGKYLKDELSREISKFL